MRGFLRQSTEAFPYVYRYFTEEERADRQVREKIINVPGNPHSDGCLCYDEKRSAFGFSTSDWVAELWNPVTRREIEEGMKSWPDWPYYRYTTRELMDIINSRDYRCWIQPRLRKLIDERTEKWEEHREEVRKAFDAVQHRRTYAHKDYIEKLVKITRLPQLADFKIRAATRWSDYCYPSPPPAYEDNV
jgi:hypothetical protein